jgi:hypothetical protein
MKYTEGGGAAGCMFRMDGGAGRGAGREAQVLLTRRRPRGWSLTQSRSVTGKKKKALAQSRFVTGETEKVLALFRFVIGESEKALSRSRFVVGATLAQQPRLHAEAHPRVRRTQHA